jgi:hypothetical protein
MLSSSTPCLLAAVLVSSCVFGPERPAYPWDGESPIPPIDTSASPNGVVALPDAADPALRQIFARYTSLTAPNGRPIHFLAQAGVSDAQLVRAREVMRFYLTDAPGTRFGEDKSRVANAMADRRATLVYFENEAGSFEAQDGPLPLLPLFYQDLYAAESVVEGSAPYLENTVRDATLEEVFHLVQGAGIRWALPEYQAILEDAARDAVRHRRWFTNTAWVFEGSTAFEYVISVIDVFYGLWAHDPQGSGESFGGEYRFLDRAQIEEHDRPGIEALRMFLPDTFAIDCTLDEDFSGTFSMRYDPAVSYTNKSRYLQDVRLTGSNHADLIGNELDNTLAGNAGSNQIDGGPGYDVVVLAGARDEYELFQPPGDEPLVVTDLLAGRDGTDMLAGIECLHFSDGTLPLVGECRGEKRLAMRFSIGEWNHEKPPAPPEFDLESHVASVVDELFALFDADGDGGLTEAEVTGDFLVLIALADGNVDGIATRAELDVVVESAFTEQPIATEHDMEIQVVFARFDLDRDGRLAPGELPLELIEGFADVDADGDGYITPSELIPTFARDGE